ncbi:hypothetical protein BT93_G1466 [Corymbia citriodora subsp. variegata]|nr:hypothetical protein BT93_G1466 [Corymbia citriodora subsp. variegata]
MNIKKFGVKFIDKREEVKTKKKTLTPWEQSQSREKREIEEEEDNDEEVKTKKTTLTPWEQHSAVISIPRLDYNTPLFPPSTLAPRLPHHLRHQRTISPPLS